MWKTAFLLCLKHCLQNFLPSNIDLPICMASTSLLDRLVPEQTGMHGQDKNASMACARHVVLGESLPSGSGFNLSEIRTSIM